MTDGDNIGPFTETFELQGGGDLTLTRFADGEHRLAVEKAGVRNSWPLTAQDMRRLREATGSLILHDATEVLRAPRSA